MRYMATLMAFAIIFTGAFGVVHSHDAEQLNPAQTAATAEPEPEGGLFGGSGDDSSSQATNNTSGGAVLFDLTTPPSEDVFFAYNGVVADGVLTMSAPVDDEAYADIFIPVQDYALEMDVTFSSFSEETIFLYFLMRIQGEFCNFEFAYDPAFGEVFTTVRDVNNCEEWTPLEDAEASALNLNQSYNFRLVAQGNTYTMFIDGQEILSVDNDSLASNGEGSVFGILGPAEATIRNLSVTNLAGTTGAAPAATTPEPASDGGLFGGSGGSGGDSGSSGGSSDSDAEPTPSGGLFGGSG